MKRDRHKVDKDIEVKVYRNKEDRIWGYTVTGHYGDRGDSIVCAGVSTLAQTTLKGLGKHFMRLNNIPEGDMKGLLLHLKYSVAPGDLQVWIKGVLDDITDALLETMLIGFYDIYDGQVRENDLAGVRIYEIKKDQEV